MAAVRDMPNINSAMILQISELESWEPDDVHGNSVRILGRVKSMNAMTNIILVEYHGKELRVSADLLDRLDRFRNGMLFQFLGELQKDHDKFVLRARLSRDMTGLETDLYDRCVRVRRSFENKFSPSIKHFDKCHTQSDILISDPVFREGMHRVYVYTRRGGTNHYESVSVFFYGCHNGVCFAP